MGQCHLLNATNRNTFRVVSSTPLQLDVGSISVILLATEYPQQLLGSKNWQPGSEED